MIGQPKIMYKNLNSRKELIHLYNPKKEGLGGYDIHYINARRKYRRDNSKTKQEHNQRIAS